MASSLVSNLPDTIRQGRSNGAFVIFGIIQNLSQGMQSLKECICLGVRTISFFVLRFEEKSSVFEDLLQG